MIQSREQLTNLGDSVYNGASARRELLENSSRRISLININCRVEDEIEYIANNNKEVANQSLNKTNKIVTQDLIIDNSIVHQNNQILMTFQNNINNNPKYSVEINENIIQESNNKNQKFDNKTRIWKKSALIILMFISKFIQTIKTQGSRSKFKQINNGIFEVINDKSGNYDYYRLNNYFLQDQPNKVQYLIYQFFTRRWTYFVSQICGNQFNFQNLKLCRIINIINPNNFIKIIWDAFVFISLFVYLCYVPLKIAFLFMVKQQYNTFELSRNQQIVLNEMPGWIQLIDIVITFNTAFYEKGELIFNRKLIAKKYLRNSFFFDFITTLIFFFFQFANQSYFELILLMRINKIIKIEKTIQEILNLKVQQAAIYDLIKLIFLILATAHLCGCVFIIICQWEMGGQIQDISIQNNMFKIVDNQNDWYSIYINGLYWAMITMMTVGYGDIVPTTNNQKLFVIFFALLGCGMFAYAVNRVGLIIQDISKRNNEFKSKMSLLSSHMKKRGLNSQLQTKVKKYFEYIQEEKCQDNEEAELMLQQLTASLRKEVLTDIYFKLLKQKKIFALNFSNQFLEELAPKLKERRVLPEEFIYKQNELIDRMYIIMKGNAQIFVQNESKNFSIKILNKGDIFGHRQFFSETITNFGVKAINIVSLVYIQKKDFLDAIKKFPEDFEKFSMMRDNINFNNNTKGVGLQCTTCGKYTHQFQDCPFINFIPNRDRIIMLFNNTMNQKRSDLNRLRFRTQNPRLYIDLLKDQLIEFLHDNNMLDNLQFLLDSQECKQIENQPEPSSQQQQLVVNNVQDENNRQEQQKFVRTNKRRESKLYGSSNQRRLSKLADESNENLIEFIKENESKNLEIVQENSSNQDSLESLQPQLKNQQMSQSSIKDGGYKASSQLDYHQKYNLDNCAPSIQNIDLISPQIQIANQNSSTEYYQHQFSQPQQNKQQQQESTPKRNQYFKQKSGNSSGSQKQRNILRHNSQQLQNKKIENTHINRKQMYLSQIIDLIINFEIDKVQNYQIYFPMYNINYILNKMKKIQHGTMDSVTKKKIKLEQLYQNALQNRETRKSKKNINYTSIFQTKEQSLNRLKSKSNRISNVSNEHSASKFQKEQNN